MLLGSSALPAFQSQELSDQPSPKTDSSLPCILKISAGFVFSTTRGSIWRAGNRGSCPWLLGASSFFFTSPDDLSHLHHFKDC